MADVDSSIVEKAQRIEVRNILKKLNDGKTLTSAERRILSEHGDGVGRIDGTSKYNVSALNIITGYDRRTLARVLGKMRGEYTIREVIEAFKLYGQKGKDAIDPVYERARKDKELADKTALENQVRRGELVDASIVDERFKSAAGIVIKHLEAIPTKAAPAMVSASTMEDAEEELTCLINDVREELSLYGKSK